MTLNEAWNPKPNDGIFSYFDQSAVPFPVHDQYTAEWNMMYHFNHSGLKTTSPLVDAYLGDNAVLSTEDKRTIADSIVAMYRDKWTRIFDAFGLKYNPIENYNSTETESYSDSSKGSTDSTITDSGSNNSTVSMDGSGKSESSDKNSSESSGTNTASGSNTSENTSTNTVGRWGFNSSDSNPTDKNDTSGSNTTTSANTTTDSSTLSTNGSTNVTTSNNETTVTEGETSNKRVGKDTRADSKEGSRTLERSGNIGVTTTQQMLTEELKLRQINLMETVFKDIDTLLTIDFY